MKSARLDKKNNHLIGWLGLGHINLSRLLNAKFIFIQIILFQIIQFSMSTQLNSLKQKCFFTIKLSQAILIQLIQFSISTDFVYTQINVKTFMLNNSV